MYSTCVTSSHFNVKMLHRFKGELAKFREGKFIVGYLQKTALTQEISHILS